MENLQDALDFVHLAGNKAAALFHYIPGSSILLRYIRHSYQNDPIRSVVEFSLFLFAIRYLLAPRYSTKQKAVELTAEEIDELVEDWTPEPLVSPPTDAELREDERRPILTGPTGPKCKLASGRTVTNLGSYNYFDLASHDLLKERAVQVLRNYGVGACGPPNFYGTQDVHMETEASIARFLNLPACICYAQAFSTISSVIPAFAKRGDIIVADRAVNYAIQKGLQISRSTVRWYAHNDMEDLEAVLMQVADEQRKKPLTRRFIVTEGFFEETGQMPNLPKLIELKQKYKYRLVLDESHSLFTLGPTGRGLTEHQHVDPNLVDFLIGSMSHTLCAGGGFCAGSTEVVEHQRISSNAYVFSAALPAMLAVTASETLKLIESQPNMLTQLQDRISAMRGQLDRSEYLAISSAEKNPRILFSLRRDVVEARGITEDVEKRIIIDVVDECLKNDIMIAKQNHVDDNWSSGKRPYGWQGVPTLIACVSTGHTRKDVEAAGSVIRKAVGKVLGKTKK